MRNPFILLSRLKEYLYALASYKQKVSAISGANLKDVDILYEEVNKSKWKKEIVRKINIKHASFYFSIVSPLREQTLYVLCRIIKPEIVVETGVSEGFSSSFILHALEENKRGHLYSIDLPNRPGQILPNGRTTGWLVQEEFKYRWTLILGSSKEKLPILLNTLKNIDIFYHDSDHSYENMMFEFQLAKSYFKEGGLLLSDDITDSSAFDAFCVLNKCNFIKLFKLGIIKNEQSHFKSYTF